MNALLHDLVFGWRMLKRRPGYTLTAILTLGLGIGLVVAQFSVVYGVFYRGIPFPDGDRIMHLERINVEQESYNAEFPIHDLRDYQEQQTVFGELAAFTSGTVNMTVNDQPIRYHGAFVTANFLDPLGARPVIGHPIPPEVEDPGQDPQVLIAWHVWQNDFAGDPRVVGMPIRVNGKPGTISGVMPKDFKFPLNEEVWVPIQRDPAADPRGEGTSYEVYGRLADDVSRDEAVAALAVIAKQLAEAYPEANAGYHALEIRPFHEEFTGGETRDIVYSMFVGAVLVLIVASTNVTNLTLAHTLRRNREMAIRASVGASRGRLVRQMLTESGLLAAAGAALGLLLAAGMVEALWNMLQNEDPPPAWMEFAIDPQVVLFAVAVALVTTLLSGIVPALRSSRPDLVQLLKEGDRAASSGHIGRISRVLVVGQVAVACAALIASALMVRNMIAMSEVTLPFDPGEVYSARLGLFPDAYPETADRQRFFTRFDEALAAEPGLAHAALSTRLGYEGTWQLRARVEGVHEGPVDEWPETRYEAITPAYFETLGVTPHQGRAFTSLDVAGSEPVVIVNQAFVARHFPDENPLGRRLMTSLEDDEEVWRTIVGVVPNLQMEGFFDELQEDGAGVYTPLFQMDHRFVTVMARPRGNDAMQAHVPVTAALREVDRDIPTYWVGSLQDRIDTHLAQLSAIGGAFGVFAFAALILAGIGIYAVISTSVTHRTREIGIRMALGARARMIMHLILRQGGRQIGVGMILGVFITLGLVQGMGNLLDEISPRDPVTYIAMCLLIATVGALACYYPARRAARVDPMVVLREE